jgi:hypothetical protein
MAETYVSTFANGSAVDAALQKAITSKQPHGFVGFTGTPSFDAESYELTLTEGEDPQIVFLDGVAYALPAVSTVRLGTVPDPPAFGAWYVIATLVEGDIALTASQAVWDIEDRTVTPAFSVYWNGEDGAVQEERHQWDRNLPLHAYLHSTRGAAIKNDGSFAQTRPSTANDGQIELVAGSLWDEEIRNAISTAQGKLVRHWYETDANVWTWANGTDNSGYDRPFLWNGDTSRVQYPKSNSAYALTDVGATEFYPVWVYASNDIHRPIYVVTPARTGTYPTLAAARGATAPVLPFAPELKLLYRWIYRGDGEYQEATDYRTSSSLPGGGVAAPVAASVPFSPTETISATNVQLAIEEVAAEAGGTSLTQSPQTITTADVTGAVNTHYLCTIAGLTANRALTLPTGTAGDQIRVTILDGDPTYALELKGATDITINGGLDPGGNRFLAVAGQSITYEATSASNWQEIALCV